MSVVYISTDVETDGPIPGQNSMLSLGAVAFGEDGVERDSFQLNLIEILGASPDPDTMAWWATQPEAWAAIRKNPMPAAEVMALYAGWVLSFTANPQFVAYPAGFDFTFVYWYLIKFCKKSPFSFSAIDVKTYAMALLKEKSYKKSSKGNWPERWRRLGPHTHVPVDDAREQGRSFMVMLKENLRDG